MAWYHDLAGGAARTVGRAYDYATPGAGTSTLTQAGRAINDPNVVWRSGEGGWNGGASLPGSFQPTVQANVVETQTQGEQQPGGGGGNNPGLPTGFVDPFAQQRANFQSRLGGAVNNIRQSGMDAFGSAGRNLRGQAEQLFNTISQGQKAIDRSRENVEMNRLGGIDDILSFVRNGLKSGASMLANKNALGSSAARAIAEAYGTEGGNRTRKVNNQASLQGREIDTQQESLDLQRGQGRTDFSRSRDDMVATIGQQVRAQLADLEDQAMQIGATGPQVEAERQRIIDEGIGQLNEVDAWLQQMLGGVGRQDMDTTRKNAVALRQGGAEMTPFEFGEFQTGFNGPAINQLPIFLRPRDRE